MPFPYKRGLASGLVLAALLRSGAAQEMSPLLDPCELEPLLVAAWPQTAEPPMAADGLPGLMPSLETEVLPLALLGTPVPAAPPPPTPPSQDVVQASANVLALP